MTRHGILLVDDHPLLRAGVRQAIVADPRFDVVGEAGDAPQAVAAAVRLRPSAVVLDLDMPGGDGFEAMRGFQSHGLQMPVVILTLHKREGFLNEAINQGASAYVLKDNAVMDVVEALRAALRGEAWFSPALSGLLLARRQRHERLRTAQPGLAGLTPSEHRVLSLVALNLTSREIADRLGSSPLTIETHRRNICRKLSLAGSHRLLQFALRHASDLDAANI